MNEEKILLSSIPLHRIKDNMPNGFASGCIISYPNNDYLFTVHHAASKQNGQWAVLCEYEARKGLKLYGLGQFHFLEEFNIKFGDFIDVDLAYAEFPKDLDCYYQELTPKGLIIKSIKRYKFSHTMISAPAKNVNYGFSGLISNKLIENCGSISESVTYHNFKYLESIEQMHIFSTPYAQHPGHEYFQGCSGAPIIDDEGHIISLVCGGDEEKNILYGINLTKYKVGVNIVGIE